MGEGAWGERSLCKAEGMREEHQNSQEQKSHTAGVAYEHANVGLHMLRDYRNKPSVSDSPGSGVGS